MLERCDRCVDKPRLEGMGERRRVVTRNNAWLSGILPYTDWRLSTCLVSVI